MGRVGVAGGVALAAVLEAGGADTRAFELHKRFGHPNPDLVVSLGDDWKYGGEVLGGVTGARWVWNAIEEVEVERGVHALRVGGATNGDHLQVCLGEGGEKGRACELESLRCVRELGGHCFDEGLEFVVRLDFGSGSGGVHLRWGG